jgi:HlyD family secretion protein
MIGLRRGKSTLPRQRREANYRLPVRGAFRRAGSAAVMGVALVIAVLVAAGGGIYWWSTARAGEATTSGPLHVVKRADFELSVTERGEVEAFDVTEVRSLVKSKNSSGIAILRIVAEGTEVKPGDFLVELDSSALVSEALLQKIAVNTANAGQIEAKSLLETAKIAVREYVEGTYKQERQTIEGEVFVAEENLNRARDYYAYSQKLSAKGYVNELQLEADRFAVEKAQKDLDAAKSRLNVLDEYTKPKMENQLQGAADIAQAKYEAAKNSYELELDKLREIEDQIAKCTIAAPQAGIVKYAHANDRRGDAEFIVEEGALIRERQSIIRLPNADEMQVKLTINESLIRYVKPGMPASIMPVGVGDRVLYGTVQRVNQYPEPSGWRRANIKEYLAYVSVDESVPELKAGLTAAVTIECARLRDVVQVPVQSVYAHGERMFCFVWANGKWEAREITSGPTNDKYFVVEKGLEAGERVALNPRGHVNEVKLPELTPEEKQRAVQLGPAGDGKDGKRGRGRRGGARGATPGSSAGTPAGSKATTAEAGANTSAGAAQ